MDFDLTDDQTQILTTLDRLASAHERSDHPALFWLPADAIEADLDEAGFYDLCRGGGSALDAVLLIERVARLPQSVEIAASALVAPLLIADAPPRPTALATGAAGRPIHFLDRARTLLVDDGRTVRAVPADALAIEPCDSIFGYPFGIARSYEADAGTTLPVTVERFRTLWRIGLAAEIAGASAGGLERTVAYVKERQQFGRPIGSFQVVQHRLAECAVAVRSMRSLVLKAAASQTAEDAALAIVFAQNSIGKICYDLQQFHGAIGLTLEYPLHFWTQRLKALQGELGGAAANAEAARLPAQSECELAIAG
ncbi:MAG: acyl-CoA dehydrogenase [Sphingomonadaceae bacterium]|nr:acyl-CoA dehydrogenase [Sphingomonadaceae bacterium]